MRARIWPLRAAISDRNSSISPLLMEPLVSTATAMSIWELLSEGRMASPSRLEGRM